MELTYKCTKIYIWNSARTRVSHNTINLSQCLLHSTTISKNLSWRQLSLLRDRGNASNRTQNPFQQTKQCLQKLPCVQQHCGSLIQKTDSLISCQWSMKSFWIPKTELELAGNSWCFMAWAPGWIAMISLELTVYGLHTGDNSKRLFK